MELRIGRATPGCALESKLNWRQSCEYHFFSGV
jgi:hypothetical protein